MDIKAEEFLSRWSISGFGTIGGTGTDTNSIGYYRNTSQTQAATKSWLVSTDSRLGLQLDFNASETLHATVQWIARDHAGDFFEQNLEWAFLRWSPRNDLDIRAGRLGTDIYLLSDYTDVGYAYLWMRPPHEFYSYLPVSHFDGLDLSKRYSLNTGFLTFKLFAGYTHTALRQAAIDATEAPVAGGNIVYNSENWQAKFNYAYIHILNELAVEEDFRNSLYTPSSNRALPDVSEVAHHLSTINHHMHFISAGGSYDDGVWQLQAEASYTDSNSVFLPSQVSAYLSIGRRFSSVTLYALYGVAQTFHDEVAIPEPANSSAPELQLLHDTLDALINNNGTDQQSVSIGMRWDFYQNIAFKAQWSHFWLGTENGAHQWETPLFGPIPNNVNVWSVGLDFIF